MLLCTIEAFKKTTVRNQLKLHVSTLAQKVDAALLPFCKVFYFLRAAEVKRRVFIVCPNEAPTEDILEPKIKKILQK